MQHIDWKYIGDALRKYVVNKYVLTIIIFAVIFIFVGDQSLINGLKRERQIRKIEHRIEVSNQAIEFAQRQLNSLQQIDSLEKYAREHYLMHKDNEEIFLVDEE